MDIAMKLLLNNNFSANVRSFFTGHALKKGFGVAIRAYLARPYVLKNCRRVCIYYALNRISFSQVYPFIYYQREIEHRYNVEIRFLPVNTLAQGNSLKHPRADIILVQTWFTVDADSLRQMLDFLSLKNPDAEISFLDSFAHSDIRLARILDPYIRFYIKKSLFKNQCEYLRSYCGDTNLTEYYGRLYGITSGPVDWKTPETALQKLRLGPNFFTAPHFISGFSNGHIPALSPRKIDVHARLGGARGTNWYQTMRTASKKKIQSLKSVNVFTGAGVAWKLYMAEMRDSNICFSPFGYGELCWRDVEAFATGAVLVKPDMSHLRTLPNLYEENETYIPIKWDFSDLPEVVQNILSNFELRHHVAAEAFRRVSEYVKTAQFVDDIDFLFEEDDLAETLH